MTAKAMVQPVGLSEPTGDLRQYGSGWLKGGPWRVLYRWLQRSRQRRALGALAENKHLLDDIGLTRQQALREASRHFWQ